MQQPSAPRSGASTLFRPQALEEIPQTFAWFEEMRNRHPVYYDETMPVPMWQIFRYEDVAAALTDYNRFSSQALGMFMGSFLKDTLITRTLRITASCATWSIWHSLQGRWPALQIV